MKDFMSAKKTINFIQTTFKETMDNLGIEVQGAGFADDEFIKVIKSPSFLKEYMESESIGSLYGEDIYRPSAFLAFIVACHEGLFNNFVIRDVMDEYPSLYSVLILSKDEALGLEKGSLLYLKMQEAVLAKKIMYIDMHDVKNMDIAFLSMSYGKLYFTFDKHKASHYIRTLNIPDHSRKQFNDTIQFYRIGRESEIPICYSEMDMSNFDKGISEEEFHARLIKKDSTL